MRSIFTFLLFCVLGFQAKAQWVDLPNNEFEVSSSSYCIQFDSIRGIYKLNTSCASSLFSLKLSITDKKGYYKNNDSLYLDFLKYYTQILRFEVNFIGFKNLSSDYDFRFLREGLTELKVEVSGEDTISKSLSLKGIPNSVDHLLIRSSTVANCEIAKWPDSLKILSVKEKTPTVFNRQFPETLDSVFLNLSENPLHFKLPKSLRAVSIYATDVDYNFMNELDNLEDVMILNTHSSLSDVNFDVKNDKLNKLHILSNRNNILLNINVV